jgi:hypothetical protein
MGRIRDQRRRRSQKEGDAALRCDARDAIEPAIDQYLEDKFAPQVNGQP